MSGEEERDEAMARAEAHAHELWKERARACLRWLNASRELWTTDDFWIAMREHYPDVTTHERRALGPMITAMIRAKEVVNYGKTNSDRPEAHKAVLFHYGRPRADAAVTKLELLLGGLREEERTSNEALARALVQRGVKVA